MGNFLLSFLRAKNVLRLCIILFHDLHYNTIAFIISITVITFDIIIANIIIHIIINIILIFIIITTGDHFYGTVIICCLFDCLFDCLIVCLFVCLFVCMSACMCIFVGFHIFSPRNLWLWEKESIQIKLHYKKMERWHSENKSALWWNIHWSFQYY